MAAKICNICNTRLVVENGLCTPCSEEGMWENEHNDQGHDDAAGDGFDDNCWICHPELNEAQAQPLVGHTNTVAKTYTSHAECTHARTPKGRAACRKARNA